jgi:hypothetical protein
MRRKSKTPARCRRDDGIEAYELNGCMMRGGFQLKLGVY